MSLHSIAIISLLFLNYGNLIHSKTIDTRVQIPVCINETLDIDSLDSVIFDLDQIILVEEDIIEIPVFIVSDDQINTLDFSMTINTGNLLYESITDHTGEIQFAAYLNPNDLRLRFTSNSFSPYPLNPYKVISIRFKVVSGTIYKSDLQMIVAYLNGEPCTPELIGGDFILGTGNVVTDEIFVSPNPASDFITINTDEAVILDMLDMQGRSVIAGQKINSSLRSISVQAFPRGSYTVRIVSKDHLIKIQRIILL